MKYGRWFDHLPPWMGWGALLSTGVYSPGELAIMAAPLAFAALVEARGWSLHRWRRLVETGALAGCLLFVLAHLGLLPTVVNTVCLLCGARLCLPRELAQRRQLLLMGFLLFLTTAISTSELDFLAWSLVWIAGTAWVLLGQDWERSAPLRSAQAPPFRLVLPWTALMILLASGFFVILPRLRTGFHPAFGGAGSGSSLGGLSDVLDLGGKGPIQGNREVVLRVRPSRQDPACQRAWAEAGLLRCFVLETLEGQRWEISGSTPSRQGIQWHVPTLRPLPLGGECFLSPGLRGLLPLPYGEGALDPSPGDEPHAAPGAAVRFPFPGLRTISVRLAMSPSVLQPEAPLSGLRLARLLSPGRDTASALAWSLRTAPGDRSPQALAERLSETLRTFRYTLDNPSGQAANPLADFLERTQAGHCEYFASALAIMLRQRGVPSRIANGYRLGPWIQEGGYFLVTQGEAHSWVEYYDAASGGWRVADPTPPTPPSALESGTLAATLARWQEALRFQWNRHVVRFSDQDQITGLDWVQSHTQALSRWKPPLPPPGWIAPGAGLMLGVALAARFRKRSLPRRQSEAGVMRELAPLLRKARPTLPPRRHETARAWLMRLAQAHPQRAPFLEALSREADAVTYGGTPPEALRALAKAEARAWENPESC